MVLDEEEDDEHNTPEPIIQSLNNYTNPSQRDILLRRITTALAIFAILLLFIGMCLDDTANGEWTQGSGSLQQREIVHCHWTHLTLNENNSDAEIGGAFVSLLCMIFALALLVVGIVYA